MLEADSNLVYEQYGITLISDEGKYYGTLKIIEKGEIIVIEWSYTLNESKESEWSFLSSPDKTVNGNKTNPPQSELATPFTIYLREITTCKFYDNLSKLTFFKGNTALAEFHFLEENAACFLDVLEKFISIRPHPYASNQFMFQNKEEASLDDKLSALNLVGKKKSKLFMSPTQDTHLKHIVSAPKKVIGFLQDMHKDPYRTAVDTITHIYDSVLYGSVETSATEATSDDNIADLLKHISGMEDTESGFEILTLKSDLAPKRNIERLCPLNHEEYDAFFDEEGRIYRSHELRKRILRGGINGNLRRELWCFLLDVYDWKSTTEERISKRIEKEEEYYIMKRQWLTLSKAQETNFSGYRDRKSIVEKDVNRTDRCHPFYEGEKNNNLVKLNDILMTYVMYNFDLGYVQGMSDLLAPILYIIEDEAVAFWCFVGFMNRMYRNFDMDQSGMKEQLSNLAKILRMVDPEFLSFLESRESANMTFCFRWLLVRFKRELNYTDTLRLWEVLWTGLPSPNFHLVVAVAILCKEREEIINNKFSFADILKHVNGLALKIDIEECLTEAEAVYEQLKDTEDVPISLREVLDLPIKDSLQRNTNIFNPVRNKHPGRVRRVVEEPTLKQLENKYDNTFDPY